MTRTAAAAWLDGAALAAVGAFIVAIAVHMLRDMLSGWTRRRPAPYWLMLTFIGVALAIDVARLLIAPSGATWLNTALHVGLVVLVLYMRRVLGRLEAKLRDYAAETARLRADYSGDPRTLPPWARPEVREP